MTRKCVTDDQYGQLSRRCTELIRRVDEGTISFDRTMKALQYFIEDKFRFGDEKGKSQVSEPAPKWREENGVIYFSVTSDGTTGENWIKRLEGSGFRVGDFAKQVLRSSDFKPTNGVTTEIAVLKGNLFKDVDRITKKIRAEADKRKLEKPNAEVACLIREKFTDNEIGAMGLWWIVAMHEPIEADGVPLLLHANRDGDGRWLSACSDRPDFRWDRDDGFAFAVSQVGS